jgi:very-short-patch-repair endonuclease
MGPYVVDFVCHAARLIIEVNGGIHQHPAVARRDTERRAWLAARGYSIVEIENERAANDPHAVADQISGIVSGRTPTPNPSPQGGGGL